MTSPPPTPMRPSSTRRLAALHVPYYLWTTTLYAGMRAVMEGRFAEAESLAAQAYQHGQRAHGNIAVHMMGAQIALLRREQGRFQEFQSIIGFAADHRADITVWKAAGVLANLEAGERRRAREDFEELAANQFAVVPDDFFRSITLGMLAESCAQLGDVERAASLYDLLLPHREQLVLLTFSVLFLGSVSYYLGILALTTGAHADAAQHLPRRHGVPQPARSGTIPHTDPAPVPPPRAYSRRRGTRRPGTATSDTQRGRR